MLMKCEGSPMLGWSRLFMIRTSRKSCKTNQRHCLRQIVKITNELIFGTWNFSLKNVKLKNVKSQEIHVSFYEGFYFNIYLKAFLK